MNQFKIYLLTVLLLIGFACGNENHLLNVRSTLIDKRWMLSSIKINGKDLTSDFLDSCDLDNYNTYATGDVLELHQGTIKCDAGDPNIFYSSWKLLGNDKFLEQDSVIYYLTHIDENTLILGFSGFDENITYSGF